MEQLEQVEMCLSVIMGHKELDTTNTHTQLRVKRNSCFQIHITFCFIPILRKLFY